MNSKMPDPVISLTRRHARERHLLTQRHAAERLAEGLQPATHLDFDGMAPNDEVWSLTHPTGTFGVIFLYGNLHLVHKENREAGGVVHTEQISDDDLDKLGFLLREFRAWRAGQVLVNISAG